MSKKPEKKSRAERRDEERLLIRALKETRPIYGKLALAALTGAVMVVCSILTPILSGSSIQLIYDKVSGDWQGSLVSGLHAILLPLAGVYILQSVMNYLKMYILNTNTSRFYTCSMRIKMADKISRLPVSYVDRTPAGQIIDRMTDDMSVLGNTVHSLIDVMMMGFMQLIAIAVTMLLEDWRLALPVLVLIPFSVFMSGWISSKCESHFQGMFEQGGRMYAHVEECFSNYRTTKAYNYEPETERRHAEINSDLRKAETTATFLGSIVRPCIVFIDAVAYILINIIGGILIVRYGVKIGTVVTIVLFAKQLSSPLEQIAEGMATLQRAKAAAKRVYQHFDAEEEAPIDGALPQDVKGDIRFEHVDFSYSEDTPLITDLNINVRKGQKIAIVGPTGAGKTTIVNLLMRFYDIQSGRITIDGCDIAGVSRDEVRALFGMVLQDTWLFGGTVADNVAYGKPGATREEIIRACDEAYCDHFIRTLPDGYDTVISEDSSTISGGQKQLLTIARALLADRRLLILDEATSNVDTRTEILLQKAMDRLMRDRTCFVIAHRLSTIIDSDLILVLRDGRIVETGTHETLLAEKGFYYDMYKSQYVI